VFSHKIDDAPTPISLLDVRERKRGHFRPAQSASEKNGENHTIAQTRDGRDIGRA
jgi:hypothetical protein